MTQPTYDVLAIGNAIMDILAKVDESFLAANGLEKGAMMLVDSRRAHELSELLENATFRSGGSAGNTIVALAQLGASAAYIGKVADDEMGTHYRQDMAEAGVTFSTASLKGKEPTARSIIVITPDGERTMSTHLGACAEITQEDIDYHSISAANIVYFEGYLWDPPQAKSAFRLAAEKAHQAGTKVAFTLSDRFCVDRYRAEFRELIENGTIDILFANEDELLALYETSDFNAALDQLASHALLAAITLGEKGAIIVEAHKITQCNAFPVVDLVDTTGAGDMFAAGFLYGVTQNYSHAKAGRLGCLLASHIIQVLGPRLETSLNDLLSQSPLD